MASSHEHPSPLARLAALIATERRDVWVVVVYSIAVGLLSLVVPVATQSLVNTVAFGTVLQPLVVLSVLVFAALGFSALLQSLRAVVVELIQRRVFVRLASEVADRLLRVRADAFDRHHGPELVNRFLDVVTVQKSGAVLLVDGLGIVIQTMVGMLLLGVYHPYLLAFDALLLLLILFVVFGLGRRGVTTSIEESKAKYATVAWLQEVARHGLSFRSAPAAVYARQRANTLAATYLTHRASHFRILLRQIVGSLVLQALASAVLLGVGGWLVIQGQLTLGQLIAAELVVSLILSGFTKFGKQLESFYDLSAALDKVGHLTDLPTERSGTEPLRRRETGVALQLTDVSFQFPGRQKLLDGVHWSLEPGSKVGLHAPSGQGKSTLLDLLYGLRSPEHGSVEIDGADFRDLQLSDLRAQVALVRHVEIFPGTVAENVSLGSAEVNSTDIREALRRVGLLERVIALPDGLQTQLATGGLPLSPSQALRLMMARAILLRPRLLLVDEVLDQIDDLQVRGVLVQTLFAPDAPWTLIVATESPQLWPLRDRVCALDGGRVVDEPRTEASEDEPQSMRASAGPGPQSRR